MRALHAAHECGPRHARPRIDRTRTCPCARAPCTHSEPAREAVEALDAANAALYWSFTQTDLYGESKTPQGVFWTNMIELYKEVDEGEDNEGVSCECMSFEV